MASLLPPVLFPPAAKAPGKILSSKYGYDPDLAFAIIGIVMFSLSSVVHSFQAYRYRVFWCFMIAIGGMTEVIGYAGRLWSHFQSWQSDPFLMQTVRLFAHLFRRRLHWSYTHTSTSMHARAVHGFSTASIHTRTPLPWNRPALLYHVSMHLSLAATILAPFCWYNQQYSLCTHCIGMTIFERRYLGREHTA